MNKIEEIKISMKEFPDKPRKWHIKRVDMMNKIITINQWNKYKKNKKFKILFKSNK